MVAHEKGQQLDVALVDLRRSQQDLKEQVVRFVREFNRKSFRALTHIPRNESTEESKMEKGM